MALAIDASTPVIATTGSNHSAATTLASSSFSPPGSSLLVVLFTNASAANGITSITDSLGAHLTYTKLISEAANGCAADVWIADVPSSAPGSMTVTPSFASSNGDLSVSVVVVTGAKAAASQTATPKGTTSASALPSATITSLVGTNSLILGCCANFTDGTVGTPGAGQSQTFNGNALTYSDGTNGGGWAQYLTGMNLAAGASATINDTAPTIDNSLAIVEILAAAGAVASIPDLIMAPAHR